MEYSQLLALANTFKEIADTLRNPELPDLTYREPDITVVPSHEPDMDMLLERSKMALVNAKAKIDKIIEEIDTLDPSVEKTNRVVERRFSDVRWLLDTSQITFEKALYI